MTKNESQQIGFLSGQMEMVLTNITDMRKEIRISIERCGPCRKEIETQTVRIAKTMASGTGNTFEKWITRGLIAALLMVCGYLFINHFMPDVRNAPTAAEVQK